MNILWLVPALPWPLVSGEKLRSYHLAVRVAAHHRVYMVAPAGGLAAAQHLTGKGIRVVRAGRLRGKMSAALASLGRGCPATVLRYSTTAVRETIRRLRYYIAFDAAYVDHLQMSGCLSELSGIPVILDEHNLESRLWQRYAENQGSLAGTVFNWQAGVLAAWETAAVRRADLVTLTSALDAEGAAQLAPDSVRVVVPNGVDSDAWQQVRRSPRDELLITGSLDWRPNREGLSWFIDACWPAIKATGMALRVVGSNPPPAVRGFLREAEVALADNVPAMQPYYEAPLAVIIPLLTGGGTRLKVLEAFAAGVPVVATGLAVEGIAAAAETHYLRADTPEDFRVAVARLRAEPALVARLTKAARELARTDYDWHIAAEKLLARMVEIPAKIAPVAPEIDVSFLLPVYNEEAHIKECLDAIYAQEYPLAKVEVLVADGGSTDRTRNIVETFQGRPGPALILLDNPRRSTAAGLNVMLGHARGKVVARVDGHSCIPANYATEIIQTLRREGVWAAGAAVVNGDGRLLVGARWAAVRSPFGCGGSVYRRPGAVREVDSVQAAAYRREVFGRVGIFDATMDYAEDEEFNWRIRQAGGTIVLRGDMELRYHPRTTLAALGKQMYNYGAGRVRMSYKWPAYRRWKHDVPLVWTVVNIYSLLHVLITAFPAPWLAVSALVFLAPLWTAYFGAAVVAVLAARSPVPLATLISFPVIHFGYGWGSLRAILRLPGWLRDEPAGRL